MIFCSINRGIYGVYINIYIYGIYGSAPPLSFLLRRACKRVDSFNYLGSQIPDSFRDFKVRKAMAWGACNKLECLRASSLDTKLKIRTFRTCVESTLLYGSETWTISAKMKSFWYDEHSIWVGGPTIWRMFNSMVISLHSHLQSANVECVLQAIAPEHLINQPTIFCFLPPRIVRSGHGGKSKKIL